MKENGSPTVSELAPILPSAESYFLFFSPSFLFIYKLSRPLFSLLARFYHERLTEYITSLLTVDPYFEDVEHHARFARLRGFDHGI